MLRVIVAEQIDSISFEGNKYYSILEMSEWFRSDGENYPYSEWLSISGDEATLEQDVFLEPKRTFETYLDSLGFGNSIDAFVSSAMEQPTRTWSENFSAERINAYIREGYGDTTCD